MDIMQIIDLTYLIEAILGVLAMLAMRYLIPWLKAKLTKEQQEDLAAFFDIAVMAAEKLYGAKQGDQKLAYVEKQLEARGIKLDTMRIKMFVNASIKKMEQAESGGVTIVENIETAEEVEAEEEDEEPKTEAAPEGA